MTETTTPPPPAAPPPSPPPSPLSDERQMALIVYVLYLASFLTGVTAIVGVVLAYVSRDTAPDWLKSHYTFQIRTFWIGLVAFAISCVLCFVLIGFVMLFVLAIWFIVRCALGLSRLLRSEAYPTPDSLIV